jgi:hypothetical protein
MADLDASLAALPSMTVDQLREAWRRLFETEPPRLAPDLLRHAIGHALQERALGGLSAAHRRELRAIAEGRAGGMTQLKPGTRLVRSWHGRTISVLVSEAGYVFEDRTYRSLSRIAREVTGAAWSGPRFFGLLAGKGSDG